MADSGHYYSLAQVRGDDWIDTSSYPGDDSWCCFNDSTVTPFDLNTLESATFGGEHEHRKGNKDTALKIDGTKPYSAYLLIYDRADNHPFNKEYDPISHLIPDQPSYLSPGPTSSDVNSVKSGRDWINRVLNENCRFIKDQHLFSSSLSNFLTQLSESRKDHPSLEMIKLISFYLFEILVHAKDKSAEVGRIVLLLCDWFQNSSDARIWFLQLLSSSHQFWAEKMLFQCYTKSVRSSFVR